MKRSRQVTHTDGRSSCVIAGRRPPLQPLVLIAAILWAAVNTTVGQTETPPAEKTAPQAAPGAAAKKERPQLPFQILRLDTRIRFEANGDSRKEVHTIVKIINILGAQQFGRISFDYNRSFQSVEIPLVRVSHANGGTSEVLPSAVTDTPGAAAEPFPAYHDVRVKSVRILGLQEGDTVEYRVVTTTTKAPLAPDFWLEHTFDRSGQVLEEHYELDLPGSRKIDLRVSPDAKENEQENTGQDDAQRRIHRWTRRYEAPKDLPQREESPVGGFDVGLSTMTWNELSARLADQMLPGAKTIGRESTSQETHKELLRTPEVAPAVRAKTVALTTEAQTDVERLAAIYDFVATKISTVDTPLNARGFRSRSADDVLNSGYGDGGEKYVLLAAMTAALGLRADAIFVGVCDQALLATPAGFTHLVVRATTKNGQYWMDPAVEVAPFGMISPTTAKCGLLLRRDFAQSAAIEQAWVKLPAELPFPATQKVTVDATLTTSGQLNARVKYVVRGENELLLRVAFHQAPKEKWKDVAGLLSLSDGFRGQVTQVEASDPTETKDPFTVEYELSQLNFVDWKKVPVRIPALLPQIGLPDPPSAGATAPIELGTPLDVQTTMTLHVPPGIEIQTPVATAVTRDYASFTSKYSGSQNSIVASRHIHFARRQIPADRFADYNAFLRAVQNDAAQRIVLLPGTKEKGSANTTP